MSSRANDLAGTLLVWQTCIRAAKTCQTGPRGLVPAAARLWQPDHARYASRPGAQSERPRTGSEERHADQLHPPSELRFRYTAPAPAGHFYLKGRTWNDLHNRSQSTASMPSRDRARNGLCAGWARSDDDQAVVLTLTRLVTSDR